MASISSILLAQGQQQAESRRQRAGRWVPLMQHLASLPGQVMQDRQAERAGQEAAFDRQQQRDVRGQQLAAGDRAQATAEATEAQKRQMNDLLATPGIIGEDGRFDVQAASRTATEKGYKDILDDVMAFGQDWNEGVQKGLLTQEQIAATRAGQLRAETADRQTKNQQGVRRLIGESVAARGGQPFSPGDAQTIQGMALQEGIDLPKGILPEPGEEVSMVVKGPNGRPTRVMVPKSRLRQGGVEEYREPRATTSDNEPLTAIIGPDGKPILVRRSQAEGKTPASTREQGRAVTSGDAGRMADFDTSLSDLKVLNTTLTETAGATGTRAAIGAGMPAWATDTFGWGVDAKKRQGVIDRVKQVIGKTLEGGVLRKEDEIKYERILPTIKDTAAVAASKLKGLDQAITQRRSTFLDALADAGYDTGRFAARSAATDQRVVDPLGIR